MGFFQATNGIDSKANVLVSGSVFVSSNISASGNITGSTLFASNNISASGDIVAGDDVFVKGMDTLLTGFTSTVNTVVLRNTLNGQLFAMPTSSFQIPPVTLYEPTSGNSAGQASLTASISATEALTLNGGYILADPNTQTLNAGGLLKIDFSQVVTDYATEIISYGNGSQEERLNLQVVLPSVGGQAGWTGYIMGYVDNNTQTYGQKWITNGSAGGTYSTLAAAGVTRRLDSSSRTLIVINLASRRLYVHSTQH
jgi:hypothetical protein